MTDRTPLEAIIDKCIFCTGSMEMAKKCPVRACPLYPFMERKAKPRRPYGSPFLAQNTAVSWEDIK